MSLDDAYRYCLNLASGHYENFPVASRLLPADIRPHVAAVYAFARTADDFADEEQDAQKIQDWRRQLYRAAGGKYENPIFQALAHTLKTRRLPVAWLDDLLTAFLQDLRQSRYLSFDQLIEYTRYSANPVGRIVLWLSGYRDQKLIRYADSITTALQLTNFWQDLSLDIPNGRYYIPAELLNYYGVSEDQLRQGTYSAGFGRLMTDLYQRTSSYYRNGFPLIGHLKGRLKWEIMLTLAGGMTILDKTLHFQNIILIYRPKLNKLDWLRILTKVMIKRGFKDVGR